MSDMKRFVVILSNGVGDDEQKSAVFQEHYRTIRSICIHYGTTDPFFGPQDAALRSYLWIVEVFGNEEKYTRFLATLENEVSGLHPGALEVHSTDGVFEYPIRNKKPDGVVFIPADQIGQDLGSTTEFSSCKVCDGEVAKDSDMEELWYHTSVNANHAAEPRLEADGDVPAGS